MELQEWQGYFKLLEVEEQMSKDGKVNMDRVNAHFKSKRRKGA